MDPDTELLARDAAAEGGLRTVSGARVREELMDLLGELEAPSAVARMRELGVDRAMHTAMEADPELVASAALGAVALGADRALAALAALCLPAAERLELWLGDLHLLASDRDCRHSRDARSASHRLGSARTRPHARRSCAPSSAARRSLRSRSRWPCGAPSEPILRWVTELQAIRLEISGADLLAEGVPEGPALGRALDETLSRKLDGLVRGREQELETALLLGQGWRR